MQYIHAVDTVSIIGQSKCTMHNGGVDLPLAVDRELFILHVQFDEGLAGLQAIAALECSGVDARIRW